MQLKIKLHINFQFHFVAPANPALTGWKILIGPSRPLEASSYHSLTADGQPDTTKANSTCSS